MKRFALASVLILTPLPALAGKSNSKKFIEKCSDLLKPSADFGKSEAYRLSTYRKLKEHLKALGVQKLNLVREFNLKLSQRSAPKVAQRTLLALRQAYGKIAEEDPEKVREIRTELLNHSEKMVNTDPYFSWLTQSTNKDPIELLHSSLQSLEPDLAIIRVYRDMDPQMTKDLATKAYSILKIHQLEVVLSSHVMDHFRNRDVGNGKAEAWNLVTSLESAVKARQELLKQAASELESRFPRVSYERIQMLIEDNDPVLRSTGDALAELREALALPESFDLKTLPELVGMAKINNSSYEKFLLVMFGEPKAWSTLHHLNQIIEVGSVIKNERIFIQYLMDRLAEDGNFSY